MKEPCPRHWHNISVDVDGVTYAGQWGIDHETIVVRTASGEQEDTQVGGTPPESLAKLMLGQMVREGRT